MIQDNIETKMPGKVGVYLFMSSFLSLILFIVGWEIVVHHGKFDVEVNGAPKVWDTIWFGLVLMGIAIISILRKYIWYWTFSFTINGNSISTTYGLFLKKNRMFDFNKVQDVNVTQGLIQRMFGVASVSIVTTSPDQVQIVSSKNGSHSIFTPSAFMYLLAEDAKQLQANIISDGAVQKVEVIPPSATPISVETTPIAGQ
jgi:uncharacterized membrane protein YdbT with pleckstrin-like domain